MKAGIFPTLFQKMQSPASLSKAEPSRGKELDNSNVMYHGNMLQF